MFHRPLFRTLAGASVFAFGLAFAPHAPAALQISEFMADNADTLTDEDGDYQDWIEIYNPDPAPVNLLGWRLTDNAGLPNKWVFPAKTIAPGARLVVFASNKNRRDPAHELHTNFQLAKGGEYLGLLRPDGGVEYDYAPAYPPQFEDVSYGYGVATSEETVIAGYQQGVAAEPGVPCRWIVPSSNTNDILIAGQPNPNSANVWIGTAFNDATWNAGSTGVGYDNNTAGVNYLPHVQSNCGIAMFNVRQSVYIRIPFTIASAPSVIGLKLRMKYDDGFGAWINGNPTIVASANANATLDWSSAATTTHDDAASIVYVDFPLPQSAVSSLVTGANVLCLQGLNSGVGSSDAVFTPQLLATTTSGLPVLGYMSTTTPGSSNYGADSNPGPQVKNVPKTLPAPTMPAAGSTVADSATEFSGNQGQNGWSYGYWTGGGTYDHNTGFIPFPGGTAAGAWNGTTQTWTGSAWDKNTAGAAPWTFVSSNTMHPNDGTPGPLDAAVVRWTSDVSGQHTITGNFTRAAAGGDGITGRIYQNGVQIFSAVSVGTAQSFAVNVNLAPGDKLDFMVDVGPTGTDDGSDGTTYDIKVNSGTVTPVALPVTAEVVPTINPVTGVQLKWRVMYNAEQTLTMFDDGQHGDGAAGDNVYGATINAPSMLSGQMIRWRVVATDSVNEVGKSPPFDIADDSPEYWGTVATDSRLATSQLPVIQTFVQNTGAADTVTGTRCSVWFLNEFYDNVGINRHGQSTGGFAKKSYNLDFNRDNRFLYNATARRVKDIDLLTNWGDKSKVRNTLAWETMEVTGSKGHFAFPVRVERNGAFFSVVDMVEDGDDRYLERVGLDPEGALYKMYNTLDSSTTNVEKKTRRWENNNNDLQALINGLNTGTAIATRRLYGYDNVDLPILMNNLAALALINSQDQGHKNYYLYKDPGLQNDWKLLAWDMDLSFGHTWTGGQNYFDDDIDSQRDMRNGATNRLKQFLYDSPELNKCWMRRMRTLMDKYYVSALSPTGYFETRIAQVLDLIDPPGLPANTSDEFLDFQRWGYWTDGNGGASIAWNNPAGPQHRARTSAQRILDANPAGTYPQTTAYSEFGNRSTVPPFLTGRRAFLYNDPSRPAGSPNNQSGAEPLPGPQSGPPPITISSVNYDPGVKDQEYLVIRNSSLTVAVDVSDWTLSGAVTYTFPGGTVIPPGGGTTQHVGDLFVTRSPKDFRLRTTSPKGSEYCYVTGPYDGQLSARGETVDLHDAAGTFVATSAWAPAPTPAQVSLRVSEIHFNPLNPSPAELAGNPSWTASDFEFIELQNTGGTTLDLSGARFDDAVTFTFPAATSLAAGARILIVADTAAFAARYSTAGLTIAGQWVGNLDNGGEKLTIYDSRGEQVLEFSYGDWYSPTDGDGYSLVFRDTAGTPYTDWGLRPKWSISAAVGGTPGAADTAYSTGYDLWENTAFPALIGDDNMRGADPDGDGLINLVEYAVNSSPLSGTQANLPQASVVTAGGVPYFAITFRRWKNQVDILYGPEISSDQQGWATLTSQHGTPADNGDGTETVTFRSGDPYNPATHQFVRLRVTEL